MIGADLETSRLSLAGSSVRHNNYLRRWPRTLLRFSIFLGMAMIGLAWTGVAFHLSMEEKTALQAAKQNSGNLVRVFAEHIVQSAEEADKALLSLRAVYAKSPEQFDVENAKVHLGSLIPQIGVIGPDGFLKASTAASAPGMRIDLSDREHYRIHADTDKDNLFISKPVTGRASGRPSIQLSRGISSLDGSFGGVIVASIDQSNLSRFYDSIDIGKDGIMEMRGLDGIISASRGYKNADPGDSSAGALLFETLQESPTGFYDAQDRIDSVRQLVSYRKIESLPLIVSVGLAQQEVFADYWRHRRIYYTAVVALTVTILIAIGLGVARKRKLPSTASSLARPEMLLEMTLESMPHGLCIFDSNCCVIVSNKHYGEMYGLTAEQTKPGASLQEILDARVAAGYCPRNAEQYVADRLEEASLLEPGHVVNELSNGRVFEIKRHSMPDGGSIEIHQDITQMRSTEEQADAARQELIEKQYAIDQAVIVAFTDVKGRITYVNDNFCQISGYTREELLGEDHRILNSGFHSETFFREMYRRIASGQVWREELCNKAKDGSLYWLDTVITAQLGPNGKPIAYMAIRIDVTARKRAEAQLLYAARHDALTGIANRAVLLEKMEEASARLRWHREAFTIFMLDLDGFKYINDTLGHAAGDQLLKEVAHRLKSSLSETEILARLGGDEFAIIQSGTANQREEAIALAIRLLEIVARPFDLDGHNVTMGTSIGIALAPENGADSGELLKKADLALYRAKSEGRNDFSVFDAELSKDATSRLQLLEELRAALSRNEFELHYQPVLDAKTRQLCGAEALVRWRHPVEGLMYPDRFIWLAEETGLIEPLGEWILGKACADATSWPANIKVAVNLSAAQFRTGKLFDVILCALVDSGLPPERLELEITESLLLNNNESYRVVIQQLKNIGIAIVLDDFGTGYSSLSYLTTFPFDKIKIDKSFTQGISTRADCAAVVASVLTLARGLDIAVTAEGVETEQQFELLRAAGVNQVQGYLFGRPRPVAELDLPAQELMGQADEAA